MPPRRAGGTGTLWPTASTRASPSMNRLSGLPEAARISRFDSRTSVRELEGASTSTRCPRRASSQARLSTYSFTSRRDSHGKGVTCAIVNRPSRVTRATYTGALARGRLRLLRGGGLLQRVLADELLRVVVRDRVRHLLGRGLHEIRARPLQRATDALVERELAHADGVDHDPGGVGRVPDLELQLHVQRHAAERLA